MRTIAADWFVAKYRYEKVMEDGLAKKVTEQYVVDAVSFGEAEQRIISSMSAFVRDGYDVVGIDRAAWKEIIFSDADGDDKWYKAKVQFITVDEVNGKEKKTNTYYLVQGASLEKARKYIDEMMGITMVDYVIAAVIETQIMDVFEYKS